MQSKDYYIECMYQAIDVVALDAMLSTLNPTDLVILYGAGGQGHRCFSYLLLKKFEVAFFVDGNEKLHNDTPFFTPIISPEKLGELYNGELIIVTPEKSGNEIREGLLKQGFPADRIYILPFVTHEVTVRQPNPHQHGPSALDYAKVAPNSPPITVVSPVYNTPKHYLRRAIESVLRQTYREFRYLIIDHASDDGTTTAVIQEYAKLDARILVVRTDVNYYNEYHAGRRDVIEFLPAIEKNIVGEYMCIIDADDYLADNFLEITYKLANTHKADSVSVGSLLTFENSNIVVGWRCDVPDCFVAKGDFEKAFMFATGNCFLYSFWSNLTRRDLFIKGWKAALAPAYNVISDNNYGFTLLRESGTVVTAGDTLHYYMVSSGSATQTEYKSPAFHLKTILIFIKFFSDFLRPVLISESNRFDVDMLLYNWSSNTIAWLVGGMTENFEHYKLTETQREFTNSLLDDILNDPFTVRVINSKAIYREAIFKLQHFLNKNVNEQL